MVMDGQANEPVDALLLERGAYLAKVGNCIVCHSSASGKPMAGGLAIATPVGNIVSTNITPSKKYGIGNYTETQFIRALRQGIRADGKPLYPAMPYTAYAYITDEDAKALYAFFMHRVEPVDQPVEKTILPFPLSVRETMVLWNLLFADGKPFVADPSRSVEYNRGAYLVRGLAHCGTCHTPRNIFLAENVSKELAGGIVGVWHAPNITSDVNSGIGGWREQEIIDYLRLGRAPNKAHAAGPMVEVIDASLQALNVDDIRAMAIFLKNVPAQRHKEDSKPVYTWGEAKDDLAAVRGVALPMPDKMSGAQLYDAYCASCHHARGQGSADMKLPALFHNTTTGRRDTDNMVLTILEGIHRKTDAGNVVTMPSFAGQLSDLQMATLGNYLTSFYGNTKAQVTVQQVATLRTGVASGYLAGTMRIIAISALSMVVAFVIWAYYVLRSKKRTRRLFK